MIAIIWVGITLTVVGASDDAPGAVAIAALGVPMFLYFTYKA